MKDPGKKWQATQSSASSTLEHFNRSQHHKESLDGRSRRQRGFYLVSAGEKRGDKLTSSHFEVVTVVGGAYDLIKCHTHTMNFGQKVDIISTLEHGSSIEKMKLKRRLK